MSIRQGSSTLCAAARGGVAVRLASLLGACSGYLISLRIPPGFLGQRKRKSWVSPNSPDSPVGIPNSLPDSPDLPCGMTEALGVSNGRPMGLVG